jgi:hypothetical protein
MWNSRSRKQVQQQAAGPADLPLVVEENAVGGINRVVRILITFILYILSVGVWFFMFRLLGKITTCAILYLLHIYNLARSWTLQPNENNNPDLWWWQRWGRTKVILMAMQTYWVLTMSNILFVTITDDGGGGRAAEIGE